MIALLGLLLGVQAQTYSYFYQGLDWGGQCVTRPFQSPVDLNVVEPRDQSNSHLKPLGISYTKASVKVVNDAVSYRLLGAFGSVSTADVKASATEVAFHAPSEHLVSGVQMDLEMQVYHSVPGNKTMVAVAVLFVEGNYNAALGTLINSPSEVDLGLIFSGVQSIRNYYAYSGSTTVPYCDTAVNWFIDALPMTASKDQLDFFRNKWGNNINFGGGNGNNRLSQAINNREVVFFQSNSALTAALFLSLYLSF